MSGVSTVSKLNIDQQLRRLKRENARLIEQEMYRYRWSRQLMFEALKDLDLMADSTVMPAPVDRERVQTSRYLSDIVSERAVKLMDVRKHTVAVLFETARRLDAIDWMLRQVEPEVRRFVEMRWIGVVEDVETGDGRTIQRERWYEHAEIERELGVSSRTLWRWRQQVLSLVAGRLGWMV